MLYFLTTSYKMVFNIGITNVIVIKILHLIKTIIQLSLIMNEVTFNKQTNLEGYTNHPLLPWFIKKQSCQQIIFTLIILHFIKGFYETYD
jgi:hypothetical protein